MTPPAPPPTSTSDARPAVRSFRVYDGETAILDVTDQPGPILSTAMLPPGVTPATHPFLSGTALDAGHEDKLRTLLVAAHSFDEFVTSLEGAGYRLEPRRAP